MLQHFLTDSSKTIHPLDYKLENSIAWELTKAKSKSAVMHRNQDWMLYTCFNINLPDIQNLARWLAHVFIYLCLQLYSIRLPLVLIIYHMIDSQWCSQSEGSIYDKMPTELPIWGSVTQSNLLFVVLVYVEILDNGGWFYPL